eukprot:1573874-Rhodomonas_salina.1
MCIRDSLLSVAPLPLSCVLLASVSLSLSVKGQRGRVRKPIKAHEVLDGVDNPQEEILLALCRRHVLSAPARLGERVSDSTTHHTNASHTPTQPHHRARAPSQPSHFHTPAIKTPRHHHNYHTTPPLTPQPPHLPQRKPQPRDGQDPPISDIIFSASAAILCASVRSNSLDSITSSISITVPFSDLPPHSNRSLLSAASAEGVRQAPTP